MFRQLLKWGAWADVKELLSPRFFEVMSTRKIVGLLRELYGLYGDDEAWEEASSDLVRRLSRGGMDLRVVRQAEGAQGATEELGDLLLRVYFTQLLYGEMTLLDLRNQGFYQFEGQWEWAPTPLMIRWEDAFQEGLRDMYVGFYRDDRERFQRGLEALNLGDVEEQFRRHFGEGHQREVAFSLQEFKEVFHEILTECKDQGIKLHYQFGALGIYLSCLYDHLEKLGGAYDVRQAVDWALELGDTEDFHGDS